jgi:hypothetical protein
MEPRADHILELVARESEESRKRRRGRDLHGEPLGFSFFSSCARVRGGRTWVAGIEVLRPEAARVGVGAKKISGNSHE